MGAVARTGQETVLVPVEIDRAFPKMPSVIDSKNRVVALRPPPLATFVPAIAKTVDEALMRALSKAPEERQEART
jgi:hypothetical protein